MELDHLLRYCLEKGASDLHLKVGSTPFMRLHGELVPLAENIPALTREQMESMTSKSLDSRQMRIFEEKKEVDVAYAVRGIGRFRINIFRQRGSISMVIRTITMEVPSLQQLGLPPILAALAEQERGLILITGVTGSGKSTSMASMISHINRHKRKHIITIEDPIEFLIRDQNCIITQRELGVDTQSFAAALKAAMRQDPDVLMIGEMRDRETIETALMAAETGHLVISTLHTKDSKETIHRILSYFPADHHEHIRSLLAANLRGILSLRLAKRKNRQGFLPVAEILINNTRISDLILRAAPGESILQAIEESSVTYHMRSFDQSLVELVRNDKITREEALRLTNNTADFELRLKGLNPRGEQEWQDYHSEEAISPGSGSLSDDWDHIPKLELEEVLENDPDDPAAEEEIRSKKDPLRDFLKNRK